MTKSTLNRFTTTVMVTVLCLAVGSLAWAQNRNGMQRGQGVPQRNALGFLQRAIQKSGAPALSSDQQTQLQTLIQNYRSTLSSTGPDAAVQTARQNFEAAVLSGKSTDAEAAADALASAMASNIPKRLRAQADFEVQALAILQPQASALQQELGNNGLFQLLQSLAGGPGMGRFGPR
jgi:Spy/CpxP family protein refolding chaperone